MPSPTGSAYGDGRLVYPACFSGLRFVSKDKSISIPSVPHRKDAVFEVIPEIAKDGSARRLKSGCQLAIPGFPKGDPGHEQVGMTVDQPGNNGASGKIRNALKSVRSGVNINNILNNAVLNHDSGIFLKRSPAAVDEPPGTDQYFPVIIRTQGCDPPITNYEIKITF